MLQIGSILTKDLVLSLEVFRDLGTVKITGFSIEELHHRLFVTADIAKRLLVDRTQSDDAYTAATFHDVGKPVLAMTLPGYFAAS